MDNSILAIYNEEDTKLGTGFVIKTDNEGAYIATCGHVVNNCGSSMLVEGVKPKIILNEYDNGLDLAVLYVKGVSHPPLHVQVKENINTVKVIGYSRIMRSKIREPISSISVKRNIKIESPLTSISTIGLTTPEPISNGYSGSPVICEDSDKVVGIICIQKSESKNYAICSKHLLEVYPLEEITEEVTEEVIKPKSYTKIEITSNLSVEDNLSIKCRLSENLKTSLSAIIDNNDVWIEPQLYNITEGTPSQEVKKSNKIDINSIINNPKDVIIHAPQQYGLTSLAHYLCKSAWENSEKSFWLYLDASSLQAKKGNINKVISRKIKEAKLTTSELECLVIDELSCVLENSEEIINIIHDMFISIPIVILNTIKVHPLLAESEDQLNQRKFEKIYLWALPRSSVRSLVKQYNINEEFIEHENRVLNKVISDLEAINIPRTPYNCLTILKISEDKFDDSPVNRPDMINRVLSYIFNAGFKPRYKTRPDLLDTEHTVGHFCMLMIKNKKYQFTEKEFIDELTNFCENNEIDLDINVIFQIFCEYNIFAFSGGFYYFKFSYWVFYFAAHGMLNNSEFSSYILSDMNYINYPEMIEFYTGIDRKRTDAISQVTNDLKIIRNTVIDKCNFPTDFNVFDDFQWHPTSEGLNKLNKDLSNGILNSDLPTSIKDSYADKSYNHLKPLTQDITQILEEYSFLRLMKTIHTGAITLRNSNYGNLKARHKLLEELLLSWSQLSSFLTSISPALSKNGYFIIGGARFGLNQDFSKEPEKRLIEVVSSTPSNIIKWFEKDIFSQKIGTTLLNRAKAESNMLHKHLLNLLIISNRPNGWADYINDYIANESKNSFYLFGVHQRLLSEYQFSFASEKSIQLLKNLVKSSLAKHNFDNIKKVNRINDKIIPLRDENKL
ncbi:hypothetical protein BCU84_16800 [Shewanella sp. 10N.286.51.B7]|uniref:S1 family peptidase n=1 Tax=Shewanella sp. 10N.286.51.B7 TaxID=1880836 RepID=UPI000C8435D9|nr:serine protease [Shewanella sp. 10N.286.51.B7]PMG74974.1 hypothetical protein BCU84_16800 [Shewanella sp. 10N.286.51.B7]